MKYFSMRSLFFMAVLLGASVLVFCPPASAKKPIKVGLIDIYSGPAAGFGKGALRGWQFVIDEFNNKGGLRGRKIVLITRDDKFKADIAVKHAKELVFKENVDLLAGTTSSSSALAVSAFAKKQKILFLDHISRSDRITGEKGHRYVFSSAPNTAIEGRAGGALAAKMGFRRWYIMGSDYEYGHAICDNFEIGLKRANPNVEIVGKAWPKVRETNYAAYLTAALAAKPDAIYVGPGGADIIPFLKQGKMFGIFEKVPVFVYGGADAVPARVLGADYPEGVYAGGNYLFYYPDTPANRAFVKALRVKFNNPNLYPSGIGEFGGYTAAKFLVEAIKKAGSVKTSRLIKALEGLVINTPIGPIKMRACDHQAMTGVFWGVTKKTPRYPFPILTNIVYSSAEEFIPSCEEIMALRKKAR